MKYSFVLINGKEKIVEKGNRSLDELNSLIDGKIVSMGKAHCKK